MSPSQPPPPQSVSHRLPWNSRLIRFRAHLQTHVSTIPDVHPQVFQETTHNSRAIPPVICLTHFRKILIGQRHAHITQTAFPSATHLQALPRLSPLHTQSSRGVPEILSPRLRNSPLLQTIRAPKSTINIQNPRICCKQRTCAMPKSLRCNRFVRCRVAITADLTT